MALLSFDNLSHKFGEVSAWYFLVEIEKVAGIPSWTMTEMDPETRFANAIRVQDGVLGQVTSALAA